MREASITVKVNGYERDTLKRIADHEDVTVSALARRFIYEGLRRYRRKNILCFTPPPAELPKLSELPLARDKA